MCVPVLRSGHLDRFFFLVRYGFGLWRFEVGHEVHVNVLGRQAGPWGFESTRGLSTGIQIGD